MATVRPLPTAPQPPPHPVAPAAETARRLAPGLDTRPAGSEQQLQVAAGGDSDAAHALLPVAPAVASGPVGLNTEEEMPAIDGPVARLPVEVDVVVPVREFRVRHLLTLEPGELIESQWSYGEDVPLAAGDVQLAWSEFEVLDNQIAVRITRLP
jgi:flagellar motor switch/type III secretory pathway protein FliN